MDHIHVLVPSCLESTTWLSSGWIHSASCEKANQLAIGDRASASQGWLEQELKHIKYRIYRGRVSNEDVQCIALHLVVERAFSSYLYLRHLLSSYVKVNLTIMVAALTL